MVKEVMESDDFVNKIPDLKDAIASIENLISDYCDTLLNSENKNIKSEIDSVKDNSKWDALKADQQKELATRLDNLIITDKQGIDGIKSILNAAYNVSTTMRGSSNAENCNISLLISTDPGQFCNLRFL